MFLCEACREHVQGRQGRCERQLVVVVVMQRAGPEERKRRTSLDW